jgi:regulator of protease activity HflC (stomatin/prohibitin superfamily)
MFNLKKVLAASVCVLSLAACDYVEPGQVGIKAYMLGGSKGVDHEVLTPGRYWIGMNEKLYIFPTFTQNYVWDKDTKSSSSPNDESITFQTKEGLSVNADFGITYTLNTDKIPAIFQKYRRGVKEITNVYLYNIVRDSLVRHASSRDVETIYGVGKAEFVAAVEKDVKTQVTDIGINIESIYVIGDFRLPGTVIEAINAKIGATQKAAQRQNEVAQAKAEADKKVEEARGEADSLKLRAEAQAEANRKLAGSISNTLVEWERLQVQKGQIAKWNGEMPRVITGNSGTLLSVGTEK